MSTNENMVAIYVPESLIPGLREFTGSILLNMDRLIVEDGFALTPEEFVTSLKMQGEAEMLAGVSTSAAAIILVRAEHPV